MHRELLFSVPNKAKQKKIKHMQNVAITQLAQHAFYPK